VDVNLAFDTRERLCKELRLVIRILGEGHPDTLMCLVERCKGGSRNFSLEAWSTGLKNQFATGLLLKGLCRTEKRLTQIPNEIYGVLIPIINCISNQQFQITCVTPPASCRLHNICHYSPSPPTLAVFPIIGAAWRAIGLHR
jgi:hypothetical protein